MKKLIRIPLCVLLIVSLFACSEAKSLQKIVTSYPQPLGYAFYSKPNTKLRTDSVVVHFMGLDLNRSTSVKRTRNFGIPLLLVNYFESNYRFNFGHNLLVNDYNEFFFNALLDESERSGNYALCFDSTRIKDVYVLDVTLKSLEASSNYLKQELYLYFFVDGYSLNIQELKPSKSQLTCQVRLSKGDQILFDKPITTSISFPNNLTGNEHIYQMMQLLSGNMVESINQITRSCIESVVTDVSRHLKP